MKNADAPKQDTRGGTGGALSRRQKAFRRIQSLDQMRLSWWATWRTLANFIQPRLGRFLENPNEGNRGSDKNQRIINNTGTIASQRCAAGLLAGTSSPARPWFVLGIQDVTLEIGSAGKAWLDTLQRRMLEILAASNFYRSGAQIFEQLAVTGTGCALQLEDFEQVIRFYPKAIGQYYLAVDARLEVSVFAERIVKTVSELMQEYPDTCSQQVRDMYFRGDQDQEILCGHLIMPNDERVIDVPGTKGMPWAQLVWEWGSSSDTMLKESGFHECPFVSPRWNVTGNDAYGRGPGQDSIGDIKSLQVMEKRKLQLIDKLVNPPMTADAVLRNSPTTSIPGGVTFVPAAQGSVGFKPAYEVQPQGLPGITAEIDRTERRVKTAFFEDLFLMISNLDTVRTAYEVAKRSEEKMLMLGPVLERVHDEFLARVIRRLYGIMARANLLPPDPPQELQGRELQITFVSTLAQAQRAVATTAVERLFAFAGSLVAVKPEVMDNLDADEAIRDYSDFLGAPPKLIVDAKKVEAVRAQRAQQEQAAMSAQTALAAAQGAKTMSETDVGGGQNALAKMMGYQAA